MEDGAYDLASSGRVGATVAVALEHDRRTVVRFDHAAEVWSEGASRAVPTREVRASEATAERALAATLSDEEELLPATLEVDPQLSG